jgi:hypothetical protein
MQDLGLLDLWNTYSKQRNNQRKEMQEWKFSPPIYTRTEHAEVFRNYKYKSLNIIEKSQYISCASGPWKVRFLFWDVALAFQLNKSSQQTQPSRRAM